MLSVLGPQRGNTAIKQKTHPTSPRISPGAPASCLRCLTFNCICVYFSNQRSSIPPPHALVGQIEPTSISDAADALPPGAMVQIGIHVSHVSRRRRVGRYECCSYGVVWGVKSGGGPPVPRHSWRASDWLKNDKNRLKIKQSRQRCT